MEPNYPSLNTGDRLTTHLVHREPRRRFTQYIGFIPCIALFAGLSQTWSGAVDGYSPRELGKLGVLSAVALLALVGRNRHGQVR